MPMPNLKLSAYDHVTVPRVIKWPVELYCSPPQSLAFLYNGGNKSISIAAASCTQSTMYLAFILYSLLAPFIAVVLYLFYENIIAAQWNPLHQIAGPPVLGWFKNHLFAVLE
jgi:hypothetical protein